MVAAALLLVGHTVTAQWPPRPLAPDVPRSVDGQPNLEAPAPRTEDGRIDLSGMWRRGGDGAWARDSARGPSLPWIPTANSPSNGLIAVGLRMTEYGAGLLAARQAEDSRDNPRAHCLPMGIVQLHTVGGRAKYVQTPRQLVILYEGNNEYRQIFTDGRARPVNDPQPWWNGYSAGRWEGDTLVIETTNFRDGGWLDTAGTPMTDAATVTERFRRMTYGRMDVDITIDDPKAYREPFSVRLPLTLTPGDELIEHVCHENNRFGRQVGPPRGRAPASARTTEGK